MADRIERLMAEIRELNAQMDEAKAKVKARIVAKQAELDRLIAVRAGLGGIEPQGIESSEEVGQP